MVRNDDAIISREAARLLRRVSLRQLIYFVELARRKNFRVAAAGLSVSQPTLSQQIAKLEQALEVSLVERGSSGFSLTPEGRGLLERITPILASMGAALEQLRPEYSDQPLRIGIPSYQSYPQIEHLLAEVKRAYPSLQPHVVEMSAIEMCNELRQGRLVAGFLSLPTPVELPRTLDHLIFWSAPYNLCFRASSRLARKRALAPRDVAQFEIILLPRTHHPAHYDYQLAALRDLGIEPRLHPSEVTNVSAQIGLANSSGAACLVSPDTIQIPDGMVVRPTEPPLRPIRLGLYWQRQSLNPQLERFLLVARRLASGAAPAGEAAQ